MKLGLTTGSVASALLLASLLASLQAQPANRPAEQANPPPPPPQPFRTEILNFDNWNVTCRDFAEGKRKHICFANLQIVQQNSGQVVFTWTIGYDDDNKLMMNIQTPTGVAIAPGVELKLAKGTRTVPYTSCEQGNCIASAPMDAAATREIGASQNIEAVVHSTRGGAVNFTIPMKGYDKAFAALGK